MIDGIRQAIASLEQRIDHRLTAFETRMDQRCAAIDQRFGSIDQRFAGVEGRLDHLAGEMSRQFRWTIGIQTTTCAVTIGTILTALFARL
jgi:ABC-type phosphate transport system auxiliary subunit